MAYEDYVVDPYSDETLTGELTGAMIGIVRRAEILLTVPVEARKLVDDSAYRRGNLIGGRPSDNLRSEADAYRRGTLTQESHDEYGRKLREEQWPNGLSSERSG